VDDAKQNERDETAPEFEAEVSDLRAPQAGRRWPTLWSAHALTGAPLTTRQRLLRGSTAAAAVLIALAVLVLRGQVFGAGALQGQVSGQADLRLWQDGLGCVMTAAWSPDSGQIATVGVQQNCLQNGPADFAITIYDARSGKVVRRLLPDVTVEAALAPYRHGRSGGAGTSLNYPEILWSHDGRRLALPFLAVLAPENGGLQLQGVLTLDTTGAHRRVLVQPVTNLEAATEWDLARGTVATTQPPRMAAYDFETVTPALAYHWEPGGLLVPDGPPPDTAAPQGGPVGNPAQGTTFSAWQPGDLSRSTEFDGSRYYHIYTWTTTFSTWSPDGRYLVDAISEIARLQPNGEPQPSLDALQAMGADRMPIFPLRDAALQHLTRGLTYDLPGPGLQLAWRPDGRVLAVFGSGDTVQLFDCTSGRFLKTLAAEDGSPAPSATSQLVVLRWSPDGSHLLLVGPAMDTLAIWGPAQLPRV
jgi:WD40 repeat protein